MAAGIYKSGVAIIVTYQAVACATGKTVTMDVYDEAHAKDVAKCVAEMTEFAATGRYYATFTPDAEGEWLCVMKNTTDDNGEVLKSYEVAGHDVDSIGDAVETVDTVVDAIKAVTDDLADGERLDLLIDAIKAQTDDLADGERLDLLVDAIKAKTDNIGASVAPASEYDTEMARITADVATEAKQDVIDGFHDVPGEDGANDAQMRDVIGKKSDTVAGDSVVALAKQLLADTGTTGSIRGADDDTLKSLSDQLDSVSAPAMVG